MSLAVTIVVSRNTTVSNEQRAYRLSLHVVPAEERSAKHSRQTQWAAVMLGAFGIAVGTLLVNFYVKPYQSVTDTLLNGQTLDWSSGEALLPIGWTLLFLTFGTLAYRVIRRTYDTGSDRMTSLASKRAEHRPD